MEHHVHTFQVEGMSCEGCKNSVFKALSAVEGVLKVDVNLADNSVKIEIHHHIPFDVLQSALSDTHYRLVKPGEEKSQSKVYMSDEKASGIYYCPMHCEGDKVYYAPGNCPVCGMNLVQQPSSDSNKEDDSYKKLKRKFFIALIFTLPIFIISMSDMIPENPLPKIMGKTYWNWLQLILSIPVVFYAAWMFFQRAYSSVIRRSLNMFTLIAIGSGVAWVFSVFALLSPGIFPNQFKDMDGHVHIYLEASTVILTLVLLGQLLEARAHNRTNSAITELLKLAPNEAFRVDNGEERVVKIDDVRVGDILRIKPGGKIPVDGVVIEGNSSVDESAFTGEPLPVSVEKNSNVKAGTINGKGSFLMKTEKVGKDSLLAQIVDLVNKASMSQAPIQKVADRISKYFVPIVISISAITFLIWMIFGPDPKLVYAFVNAIAVLIIACPCALGLATPMSIMVGVGKGAKNGVLIRNAEALETLAKVNVLIVDKTGTLTEGRPSVEKVVSINEMDERALMAYIAGANRQSEHPLAEATVRYAENANIEIKTPTSFESITGKGVSAVVDSKNILVGNLSLMELNNISISNETLSNIENEQRKGKTVPLVAVDGAISGYVLISDAIKETTHSAIKLLKSQGIKVIMMTGDNEFTASSVAEELNISDIQANCLPQDKLNKIKELQSQGFIVGMVGDGVNDAPALAIANVGIAMGTGNDLAIETAGITILNGDIGGVVKAKVLSSKVMRNIKENLFFALIYNSIGVPVAAGVLFPFFGILLSPMIAALAMSFSSISVIANALRLKSQSI